MKYLILVGLLLLFYSSSFSQIHLIPYIGVNRTQFPEPKARDLDVTPRFGLQSGVDIETNGKVFFNGGAGFLLQRYIYSVTPRYNGASIGRPTGSIDYPYTESYIQLRALAGLKIWQKNAIGISVQAGPVISALIQEINSENLWPGLRGALAIDWNSFRLNLSFDKRLTEVEYRDSAGGVMSIDVGYRFPLKKK